MNDLLLKALRCNNSARPPVWLMRQAGRYMSSYRALRKKYSFLELCHQPELITEVTLSPIKQFGFDAAILFSDILMIPEAMGVGLRFEEEIGPIIERPIKNSQDIENIGAFDKNKFSFLENGIKEIKKSLQVPLLGFCGAPFTVASYMIEGQSSRDQKKTKQWLFSNPHEFHQLLKKIADWSIDYLNLQIDAGVDAIQIFDSWANSLGYNQFCEFSLPYFQYIMKGLKNPQIPVIIFCRGSSFFAHEIAKIQPAAISLDWNCDLKQIRKTIDYPIALQGNLDPHVLYGSKQTIQKEVGSLLENMKGDKGFIFNLGHGILPDVPESAVHTLVECVKSEWRNN